jgi:fructose-bisphosphate aldolase class 1
LEGIIFSPNFISTGKETEASPTIYEVVIKTLEALKSSVPEEVSSINLICDEIDP